MSGRISPPAGPHLFERDKRALTLHGVRHARVRHQQRIPEVLALFMSDSRYDSRLHTRPRVSVCAALTEDDLAFFLKCGSRKEEQVPGNVRNRTRPSIKGLID